MKSYFALFSLLFILSCNKEKKTPSSDEFPDAVGDHWVYKYYDGYANGDQYIYVDIVGTGKLPDGQKATIWRTILQDAKNNKYLIDSSFVVVDNQKAVFYAAPCLTCEPPSFNEKRRFIFPLQVGKVWGSDTFFGDTTRVLSENKLMVPAGMFDNTFELSKTVNYYGNSSTNDTIWLTSNIGMTQYHKNEYSLGPLPGNGIWKLASYELK